MTSANPFFDIRKEFVLTESGIPIDNKVALINTENNKPVGLVSKGYKVTTNKEVADIFEVALTEAFGSVETHKVVDHLDATGKKWKRQIILGGDQFNFDVTKRGDIVGIMLTEFNGYDGKTAVGYDISGYRYACTNGLVTGIKKLFAESFAHVSDNVTMLVESFNSKFDLFNQSIDVWSKWSELPYTQNDFEAFLKSREYLSEKARTAIVDQYVPIMNKYKESDETKWHAFNVLTEIGTHNTKARNGSNVFSNGFKTMEKVAYDFYVENQLLIAA